MRNATFALLRALQFSLLLGITILPSAARGAGEATTEARLHALFERDWAFRLEENPFLATAVGESAYNDRLPAISAADQKRRAAVWRGMLEELATIDPAHLGPQDQISREVFRRQLEARVEEIGFAMYEMPLTTDNGFHIEFARLPFEMPFSTAADYERYIARLRAFPDWVDQHIVLMKRGVERGMSLPQVVLNGYEVTIGSHVVEAPEESLFYHPFQAFPATFPAAVQERLRNAGRTAVMEAVVPAYERFLTFMVDVYIPGARTSIGASELPDGQAFYQQRIRYFTTLDVTAEEVHRIGREEVARIRGEMEAIIEAVGFEGDFAAFLAFLRTDPRFYPKTPEALLKEASYIAKRMDAQLPAFFGRLPRQPYGVAPVPEHLAPKYTAGRYVGAAPGGTQPGYYWVNTYALDSRPLYALEALSLHEAVPGHHLQIALAQEMEDLPLFRRFDYISAFGEGWGLYAERLGLEAGFYTDPYSNFGRLTYEMWRACRLVVDTGIHAFGWTRDQVLDYLATNTALSLHEVETETDRYISWPGQALAYKMGELKIRALRQQAEEALGEHFDIRAFHDAVLRNGAIPLPVLETVIARYIEEAKSE